MVRRDKVVVIIGHLQNDEKHKKKEKSYKCNNLDITIVTIWYTFSTLFSPMHNLIAL